jgi:hypothetical protein
MLRLGAVTLFGCLLTATGCGGNRFPVSTVEGTVSVDGEPVGEGSVIFTPLESNTGQAIAAEIRDGKYHSKKVPRGKSLVMINAMKDIGEKHVEFGITYPKPKNLVPEKYRSGIELNVDAPTLKHNFELESK